MLKPPHPVARLAYASRCGSIPTTTRSTAGGELGAWRRRRSRIAACSAGNEHLGHLCGGGTMANLEALWVAGRLRPGGRCSRRRRRTTRTRASARCSACVRIRRLRSPRAAWISRALERRLAAGGVGTVVATLGTDGGRRGRSAGRILALRDAPSRASASTPTAPTAATSAGRESRARARAAFAALPGVDSIVVDPHKHGLQPYGCGSVLFRDPAVGALYKHDSPYTYFSSSELHLGEISLECSRAGASAVGLWATQRCCRWCPAASSRAVSRRARGGARAPRRSRPRPAFLGAFRPSSTSSSGCRAPRASSASSELARRIFDEAARRDLHLALAELPAAFFDLAGAGIAADRETSPACGRC
jgi:hypothetical protein